MDIKIDETIYKSSKFLKTSDFKENTIRKETSFRIPYTFLEDHTDLMLMRLNDKRTKIIFNNNNQKITFIKTKYKTKSSTENIFKT